MNVEEVVFLGTGTSGQVPSVNCLTAPHPSCPTCLDSVKPDSKNRRRNTSLLIRLKHSKTRIERNIVVDVGKSFYDGAMHWFPRYGIRSIDAIILTHEHADAILGLDDLRDWTMHRDEMPPIPIYLSSKTMATVTRMFPYLIDASKATGSGLIPRLKFIVIDPPNPFEVEGVVFAPFEVPHGKDCTCLGFRFSNVVYLSDVSEMTTEHFSRIHGCDVFIVDTLKEESHVSHFGLEEAITSAHRIQPPPSMVYLTGMCHTLEHSHGNRLLRKRREDGRISLRMELAFDGLRVDVSQKSRASLQTAAAIAAELEHWKHARPSKEVRDHVMEETTMAALMEAGSVADTVMSGSSDAFDQKVHSVSQTAEDHVRGL